ncbi:MAG TPA: right-handed parallel beta-helix repeat-containing protein, partial [Nitrososphaeraceae archaeon]|nr:right-handed parallel beta-helix repeat-containing protein [Nitrososphaeraceae archaeon]
IINIDNQAQVSIKGFTIKGFEDTFCDTRLVGIDRLVGISVFTDAILTLDSVVIKDCTWRSVSIGSILAPEGQQTGHATITNTVITEYEFDGVAALVPGTTLTMSYNKIIGSISNVTNPAGISIVEANATITHNEVSGNICDENFVPACGPDWFNQLQAFGIITQGAGGGSVIAKNYLSDNDAGIGIVEGSGCCLIDHNKLTDNHIFGIVIADGEHTVSNTKIFGGQVGAAAAALFYNTTATLDQVKIIGTEIPIQALSTGNLTAAVNVFSPSFFKP